MGNLAVKVDDIRARIEQLQNSITLILGTTQNLTLAQIEQMIEERLGASVAQILAQLRDLDISSQLRRVEHLERIISALMLELETLQMHPDADAIVVEELDNPDQVDLTATTVLSVVSGDDSIDVTDSTLLVTGGWYQLTDGQSTESVRIKSIHTAGETHRIILESPVAHQYLTGRAALYRSSVAIIDSRAYAGGQIRDSIWAPMMSTWTGQASSQAYSGGIQYNSATKPQFTYDNNSDWTSNNITLARTGGYKWALNDTYAEERTSLSPWQKSGLCPLTIVDGYPCIRVYGRTMGESAGWAQADLATLFPAGDFAFACTLRPANNISGVHQYTLNLKDTGGKDFWFMTRHDGSGTGFVQYGPNYAYPMLPFDTWTDLILSRSGTTLYIWTRRSDGATQALTIPNVPTAAISSYGAGCCGWGITPAPRADLYLRNVCHASTAITTQQQATDWFTSHTFSTQYVSSVVVVSNLNPIDTTQINQVSTLGITAETPGNTSIKFALRKNAGAWKKWGGSSWSDLATQTLTNLATEGNLKSDLEALNSTNLAWLAGGAIDIAAALSTSNTSATPTLSGLTLTGATISNQSTTTIVSDILRLSQVDAPVEILDATTATVTSNGGSVAVDCSLQQADNTWSDWMPLTAISTAPATKAKAIKLRATLTAPTVGVSQASLSTVDIKHRIDDTTTFAVGEGALITKTYDFLIPMSRAHALVTHPAYPDTVIRAYISLRPRPNKIMSELLGVGNGMTKSYLLAFPQKIAAHTFRLFFDGEEQTTGYAFSPLDGQVTCIAPDMAIVTCDYTYNWEAENWTEMAGIASYPAETGVTEEYLYSKTLPEDPEGSIASLKILLEQHNGTVTNEPVAQSTGSLQLLRLAHTAKPETITIKTNGETLETGWTYEEATNTLLITATAGKNLTADYKWVAPAPWVEAFSCTWNE